MKQFVHKKKFRMPRKMKKALDKYIGYFYDGWWPVFMGNAKYKKHIERFLLYFCKIDNIRLSDNPTDEEKEEFKRYWVFHYYRHILRNYYINVNHKIYKRAPYKTIKLWK